MASDETLEAIKRFEMESKSPPCPLGRPDGTSGSHEAHDTRIRELEEFQRTAERTPRILAARIIKLEKVVHLLEDVYGHDTILRLVRGKGIR